MEPTNVNPTSPGDDRFEEALRAHYQPAPLPADAFTRNVLAALPPPTPQRLEQRSSLRLWLCLAGGAVGCYLAKSAFSNGPGGTDPFQSMLPDLKVALEPLATSSTALALAVTAGSLMLAYWRRLYTKLLRLTAE